MSYQPNSIISGMHDECVIIDHAIDQVLDAWDDKVSEKIQATTINEMIKSANEVLNSFLEHSNTIVRMLDEMEMYARR